MPSLWIIDGYNFIRQSRRFAELEAHRPEQGRKAAMHWLNQFAERTGLRVCLVLDAYGGLHSEPVVDGVGALQLVYSRGGYTADEEIIALAQQKQDTAIVVSSDKAIIKAALKAGASYLESREFEQEVGKILAKEEEEEEEVRHRPDKGNAFQPPKAKKKAFHILKKYQ